MARTMEAIGGDGFAIRQGLWPGYVGPCVEQVIPLLQQLEDPAYWGGVCPVWAFPMMTVGSMREETRP
jgi:hypothetical protein